MKHDLPICACIIRMSEEHTSSIKVQIAKALDTYVRLLSHQIPAVSAPDIIDIYSFGKLWFKQLFEHDSEKECMYVKSKNALYDVYNEYHVDFQMPRYNVAFHMTIFNDLPERVDSDN